VTTIQIERFVAEMERRWRSRTPTTDPNYAHPDLRVGRSEMVTWAKEAFGFQMDLVDSVEPTLVKAIDRMWRRLRRQFPDEWGGQRHPR
jgi:hypothetical protein